jgi:SIR2-like domain
MQKSVLFFLGAGYSSIAGVPLAKNLFRPNYLLAMSERSESRFKVVLKHYENWQQNHPAEYPEQYLGILYNRVAGTNAPQWDWAVEYVSAVIASAGTPPSSLNRNPRYSNRVNRPSEYAIHRRFWNTILDKANDLSVVTTNYDILIERTLRHRPMHRPPSPGCFYGGLPRPQRLKGAAQPFSIRSPERLIEMTGTIPVYKLHGSLNWSLTGQTVLTYQDMRPVFRHGGDAAIIPPIPEKLVPAWLKPVWDGAASDLRRSNVWVICGYSAPAYDAEVLRLLRDGGTGRSLAVILLSPDSDLLRTRWRDIVPEANIIPLPGLPEGIQALADNLAAL